jgi:hypothetical protein
VDLSDAIAGAVRPPAQWQVGTVTGTSGAKVVVTVSGTSYTIPRNSQYSPVNGDVVLIAWIPGQPIVICKIAV